MKKIILAITLLMLLSCLLVSAKTYHMTLLTIGEAGEDTFGGTADAYLEVKYGTGRIYLDSFPLTKLDTQISTRYANEIACDYLNKDCSHHDFFYTIRADSTIVGGPSASAPLTILTIAALKNLELSNDTVMTGTINSGGSIGPVGGVVKKAMAAEKAGLKRILIPTLSLTLEEEINQTTNITNRTKELSFEEANLSIEVINVSNIDEALAYFTNKPVQQKYSAITVPGEYTAIMKNVSESLCARAINLKQGTKVENEEDINKTNDFLISINKSIEEHDYYSAASYCFSLGLLMKKINLKEIEQRQSSRITLIYESAKKAVGQFDSNLEKINLTTLPELETYVIVKERLIESEKTLTDIANNITTDDLAYAIERYYSAVYWSAFFAMKGKEIELDQQYLETACYKKISEADERLNYAGLYIPVSLQNAQEEIDLAYAFAIQKNYKMCLFKASFAKAESNMLLSTIAIQKNEIGMLIEQKLEAAKSLIAKEQSRGFFPIMGYSYYEYANSLNENQDAVSALVFSEYALELSNLEIYFPKKALRLPNVNYSIILLFASAFTLGMAVGGLIILSIIRKKLKLMSINKKNKRIRTKR